MIIGQDQCRHHQDILPTSSIIGRANQPVDEDGMWKLEEGTADSSKNHKNFNSGVPKGGRFVSK